MQSSLNKKKCAEDETHDSCPTADWPSCVANVTGKCVFPFKYREKVFDSCTDMDSIDGSKWCSHTSDYDKDQTWGSCNRCRGEQLPLEQALVQRGCKVLLGGEEGWVWDPFLLDVRAEYLDCSALIGRGMPSKRQAIPFQQSVDISRAPAAPAWTTAQNESSVIVTAASSMHFAPAYYESTHRKTLACMHAFVSSDAAGDLKRWQWQQMTTAGAAPRLLKARMRTFMHKCMLQKPRVWDYFSADIVDADRCKCDTLNADSFTVSAFHIAYASAHRCSGGPLKGKLCTPVDQQKGQEVSMSTRLQEKGAEDICKQGSVESTHYCREAWPGQKSIAQSAQYGCFFEHPDALTPVAANFQQCGWSLDSSSGGPMLDAEQKAVDVYFSGYSKRTFIVTLFLVKEGTYLTAYGILAFLSFFCTIFALLFYLPVYLVRRMWVRNDPGSHASFLMRPVGTAQFMYDIAQTILEICFNMSSFARIFGFLVQIYTSNVNFSIKDMMRKVTDLANVVFTFGLMLNIEETNLSLLFSILLNLLGIAFALCSEQVMMLRIAAGDFKHEQMSRTLKKVLKTTLAQIVLMSALCVVLSLSSLSGTHTTGLKDLNHNRLSKFEVAKSCAPFQIFRGTVRSLY
jgi:hypothetical protein